jgi:hypothetical protein
LLFMKLQGIDVRGIYLPGEQKTKKRGPLGRQEV